MQPEVPQGQSGAAVRRPSETEIRSFDERPLDTERPRRKRRVAPIARTSRNRSSTRGDVRELAAIKDADALFRWALAALPVRNALSDASRSAVDTAFLEKAEAVGA